MCVSIYTILLKVLCILSPDPIDTMQLRTKLDCAHPPIKVAMTNPKDAKTRNSHVSCTETNLFVIQFVTYEPNSVHTIRLVRANREIVEKFLNSYKFNWIEACEKTWYGFSVSMDTIQLLCWVDNLTWTSFAIFISIDCLLTDWLTNKSENITRSPKYSKWIKKKN